MLFRVLVLEDNAAFSFVVCAWLAAMPKLEVIHTDDGIEGKQLADAGGWDLIICDLGLPGIDGLALLPIFRERSPAAKIVVLSGSNSIEDISRTVGLADAFLSKPVTRNEFETTVSRLVEELEISRNRFQRHVLAIGAHPDDVEIGCGGTLARLHQEGAKTFILTLSGGEAGGERAIRRQESSEAARLLGAQLIMLNLPDGTISAGPETIQQIHRCIELHSITHVYTHTQHDAHQDHRAAHAATLVAARRVPNLLCYQSPSTNVAFMPTFFVEIREQFPKKLEAIAAHATQATTRPYMHPEQLRATARYWGRFCGYGMAEPFDAIRLTQN